MKSKMKVGDLVKYTKEWSREYERECRFIILEVKEPTKFVPKRSFIIQYQCDLPLKPTEEVDEEMIELA